MRRMATRLFWPIIAGLFLVACENIALPGSSGNVDVSGAVVVGLLLPTAAENPQDAQLGAALASAARMAQNDVTGAEIDLRIYPTAGDSSSAAAAARQAIADGAKALVGPLFASEAAAVGPLARAAAVPVLSLSNNTSVAGGGVYVLGVTYASVADRLVGFSVARGLRNIGIVYQDGVDGAAGRAAIEAAIAKSSASLAAAASYPLTVDGIGAASGGIAAQMKSTGANAVFFTDTPTGGLGFVTADLRAAGLGASAYQFIGLTRWDASTDALAQPSLGGGWFALPDPALTSQFESRYLAAYGEAPHDLSGVAYDAVAAVGAMLSAARLIDDHDPFALARITDPAGFAGVNGVFRLLADGSNERGLAVMQVSAGAATIVDPAPRRFGGPES